MTIESKPLRVRALSAVLNGADPVEYMLGLIEGGYNRFYVAVPEGFRCDFREPGLLAAHRIRGNDVPNPSLVRNCPEPDYLQLDEFQIQKLLLNQPITLAAFSAGALFRRLRDDRLPSIDFDHQRIRSGSLEPRGRSIADATTTMFNPSSGKSMVVKSLIPNSNMYSYSLQGVDFNSIFIEAVPPATKGHGDEENEPGTSDGDKLKDPYGLERSSPLVFAILARAYRNRGKERSEIDTVSLAAEFKKLNSKYPKNPKPFNDGRHEFAATLANPRYSYSSERVRQGGPPEVSEEVPSDPFLDQEFINRNLRKVIFAALRWSDAKEPGIGRDREKLVELLVRLGFFDADESDQVQSAVFFITGAKYPREKNKSYFRHTRRDRD